MSSPSLSSPLDAAYSAPSHDAVIGLETAENRPIYRDSCMSIMAQLNMRIDDELKANAERQFKAMGMSALPAVSIFFAQVVLNHGIPFAVQSDPFYSRSNMDELARRAIVALQDLAPGIRQTHAPLAHLRCARRRFCNHLYRQCASGHGISHFIKSEVMCSWDMRISCNILSQPSHIL